MSRNDTTHVQTELSDDEYEQFRAFARERGLSLKEAGHEAVREWIERQQRADPNDPAFTILDGLAGDPDAAPTDARDEDDLVDTWHGSDVAFSLDDDPSADEES